MALRWRTFFASAGLYPGIAIASLNLLGPASLGLGFFKPSRAVANEIQQGFGYARIWRVRATTLKKGITQIRLETLLKRKATKKRRATDVCRQDRECPAG